jgi:hypothetical protein
MLLQESERKDEKKYMYMERETERERARQCGRECERAGGDERVMSGKERMEVVKGGSTLERATKKRQNARVKQIE